MIFACFVRNRNGWEQVAVSSVERRIRPLRITIQITLHLRVFVPEPGLHTQIFELPAVVEIGSMDFLLVIKDVGFTIINGLTLIINILTIRCMSGGHITAFDPCLQFSFKCLLNVIGLAA